MLCSPKRRFTVMRNVLGAGRPALLRPPHSVQTYRVVKPPQGDAPFVREQDPLPRSELPDEPIRIEEVEDVSAADGELVPVEPPVTIID